MGVQSDNWPSVRDAMQARTSELKMSTAELARRTGLSESTIRYIGEPGRRHNRSSLVAISAVLRWRYDYLTNILNGHPEKNVKITPPVSVIVEGVVRAEIGPLRRQVSDLTQKLNSISRAKGARCQRAMITSSAKCGRVS